MNAYVMLVGFWMELFRFGMHFRMFAQLAHSLRFALFRFAPRFSTFQNTCLYNCIKYWSDYLGSELSSSNNVFRPVRTSQRVRFPDNCFFNSFSLSPGIDFCIEPSLYTSGSLGSGICFNFFWPFSGIDFRTDSVDFLRTPLGSTNK